MKVLSLITIGSSVDYEKDVQCKFNGLWYVPSHCPGTSPLARASEGDGCFNYNFDYTLFINYIYKK